MIVEHVILAPVVTEKAIGKNEEGQYVFWINRDATKIDVKIAFAQLYGRTVSSVQVGRLPKKVRLLGKNKKMTKRQAKKKAYVRFTDAAPFELQMIKK